MQYRSRLFTLMLCFCSLALTGACGTAERATREPLASPSDEMIDIGYENTPKGELSYAVSSVKPAEEEMVYSNMYDYLRGRVAGVEVGPGNTPSSVRIRGVNSINASTAPLVLVDGMESDLGSINPYDVYSVSVLKDSSASIYGVRGANGVILITTKQARNQQEAQSAARKKAKAEKKAARAAAKKK